MLSVVHQKSIKGKMSAGWLQGERLLEINLNQYSQTWPDSALRPRILYTEALSPSFSFSALLTDGEFLPVAELLPYPLLKCPSTQQRAANNRPGVEL